MNKQRINRKFIAAKAGVSTATVSYVLNKIPHSRVSEKTRKRVIAAAKKYNYFPNILARSLAMNKTFNIGFINTLTLVDFLSDSFQNSIFAGIEREIENNGYSLLFSLLKGTDSLDDLNFSVRKMICGNIVDGIVLYGKVEPFLVEYLLGNNVKFVLVDFALPNIKTSSVLPDNITGAYEATRHLIKKNCKKIYCINGDFLHPSYTERPEGYKKALKEAGLQTKIFITNPSIDNTYSFIKNLINKQGLPDAFFATGDHMAIGILRCLKDKAIKVPEQVKVVGFDDLIVFDREQARLTTVNVPKIEMGQEAVKILLQKIKKDEPPQIYRLPTRLVIRETA